MNHPYQFLLPLLSLFWIRVDLTDLMALEMQVQILNIRDGDTLTVKSGSQSFHVRLSRIDAPELHQNFHDSKIDAGIVSRNCLRKLSPQKTILRIEGFDIYHRILGDVGGLNYQAVENGCSGLYPHAQFSSVSEKILYVKALMDARKKRRGVWAYRGYMLPKKWRKISKRNGYRPSPQRAHSRVTYRPERIRARKEY
ncbi:MAG: thermonuclease family protein [Bdellovibrionota bacterium]